MALAESFGVSRGPIRHALLQLTKEGLLESKSNVGVKVAKHPSIDVFDVIVKLRQDIESFVVSHVFDKIDSDDLLEIEEILSKLKKRCEEGDINAVYESDFAFHEFFIRKFDDKHILDLWYSIISRMMMKYTRFEDDLMGSYREHKAIYDLIVKEDKAKTISQIMANIQ